MASEVISHAIFASFHLTPPATHRIVLHSAFYSASHSTSHLQPALHPAQHSASHSALRPTSRPALHSTSYPALHSSLHSASRLSCTPHLALHSHPTSHHALHPAPRPPFPSLSLSQVSSSSHRQALPPRHSIFLPSTHFPSPSLHPSLFLSQAPLPRTSPRIPSCPSPCAPTPFLTTHFPSASLHPSLFLSQVPPVDFLVRKKARFTHDMTFFHHDVCGKRFNAHEGSHKMEMIISKDHVAEKPRRGWGLWRHGRP